MGDNLLGQRAGGHAHGEGHAPEHASCPLGQDHNIAGLAGLMPPADNPYYSAAKAAILAMTASMAKAVAAERALISCIAQLNPTNRNRLSNNLGPGGVAFRNARTESDKSRSWQFELPYRPCLAREGVANA